MISITPVVVQEMRLVELVDLMLSAAGKNSDRIRELLRRGTLVSGASRFRWSGWEADRADLEALLSTFPDPDPQRRFAPEHCIRATLRGTGKTIDLPREIAERRRLLSRSSFWTLLLDVAAGGNPIYHTYSYKERADHYRLALTREAAARVRAGAGLLRYSGLVEQVRTASLEALDLYTKRL